MHQQKLLQSRKETKRDSGWKQIEYDLPSRFRRKLDFRVHDIIDAPFERGGEEFDVIFANNLLMHYPKWTRELMLINLLANQKDLGMITLEHEEMLGGIGSTPERTAWLAPYYEWRKDLSRFGLEQVSIESETSWFPLKLLQYHRDENQFAGRQFALRDRQLVDVSRY
jgi:hypothetical protein